MNNPSPLIPQGSLLEQKAKKQSRLKIAVFAVLAINIIPLTLALLLQGCKREQPVPPPEPQMGTNVDTTMPTADTNMPPYVAPTSAPPVVVEPPVVTPSVTEYTIEKGDTFFGIAKKHGVSMKAVKDANPGVEPTKLKLGQKIVIPAAAAAPTGGPALHSVATGEQTYTVKSGDTLSKIATHSGTTVKAIRAANSLTTDKIKVGDKLKIPAKTEAPPPIAAPEPVPATPAPAPAAAPVTR
jgi:LysM repeat protein